MKLTLPDVGDKVMVLGREYVCVAPSKVSNKPAAWTEVTVYLQTKDQAEKWDKKWRPRHD